MSEHVDSGELSVEGRPFGWLRDGPDRGAPVVILAHGAGAPCTHEFMVGLAARLAGRGLTVVRFNFPYMERAGRERTRRPPDATRVLLAAWETMLDAVLQWDRFGPLVLAGKSMGGRMASMLLAEGRAPTAAGAVYFGYPLHPAKKPDQLRAAHLPAVPVPQLFISGTRDPLCDLDKLRPILVPIENAELFVVEGGDHSLATNRRAPWSGAERWIERAAEFAFDPGKHFEARAQ